MSRTHRSTACSLGVVCLVLCAMQANQGGHTRNKEGDSLSRVPATSPGPDIALRSPTAQRFGAGILTSFSFAPGAAARGLPPKPMHRSTEVSLDAKIPTNPQSTAVVEEPCSTSAFRVLHMNTCYYYQDLLPRPVRALSTVRFNPTGVSALLVYP